MKLGSPGVSTRLTLTSRHSNEASDAEMDMPRAFSSSSASETVVPSATEPSLVVAPASNSSASCNDVFPLPRWPTRATLRILSAACSMPGAPLSLRTAGEGGPYCPRRNNDSRLVRDQQQRAVVRQHAVERAAVCEGVKRAEALVEHEQPRV